MTESERRQLMVDLARSLGPALRPLTLPIRPVCRATHCTGCHERKTR